MSFEGTFLGTVGNARMMTKSPMHGKQKKPIVSRTRREKERARAGDAKR